MHVRLQMLASSLADHSCTISVSVATSRLSTLSRPSVRRSRDGLDGKAEKGASKPQAWQGDMHLLCRADLAVLAQALPLQPHSRVVVPLVLHAPKARPAAVLMLVVPQMHDCASGAARTEVRPRPAGFMVPGHGLHRDFGPAMLALPLQPHSRVVVPLVLHAPKARPAAVLMLVVPQMHDCASGAARTEVRPRPAGFMVPGHGLHRDFGPAMLALPLQPHSRVVVPLVLHAPKARPAAVLMLVVPQMHDCASGAARTEVRPRPAGFMVPGHGLHRDFGPAMLALPLQPHSRVVVPLVLHAPKARPAAMFVCGLRPRPA